MVALQYLGLAIGLSIAVIPLVIACRLARIDRFEAKRSASRVQGVKDAIMGRARTRSDWLPDGRIKAGMTFNRRENRIEVSGRLSDEAFDRIFRPKHTRNSR